MRALARVLPAILVAVGCASPTVPSAPGSPPATQPIPQPVRVLMLTATAGFRHDSIPTARTVVASLASRSG
jgi:hypothetical protein